MHYFFTINFPLERVLQKEEGRQEGEEEEGEGKKEKSEQNYCKVGDYYSCLKTGIHLPSVLGAFTQTECPGTNTDNVDSGRD